MIKVVLLGAGNVACQLARALQNLNKVELVQRYSRTTSTKDFFDASIPCTSDLKQLEPADLYILAIKDEAIAEVAEALPELPGVLVHTSGAIGMEVLQMHARYGVMYPVQSLSMHQTINLKEVPLAIETNSKEDLFFLKSLSSEISDKVFELDSFKRQKLHITAVFANNFSNYMFTCAEDLCRQFDIPFDILRPMILETGKKVQYMRPFDAQTGPARRLDLDVIHTHEKHLKNMQKEIYQLLTQAIIKTYQKA